MSTFLQNDARGFLVQSNNLILETDELSIIAIQATNISSTLINEIQFDSTVGIDYLSIGSGSNVDTTNLNVQLNNQLLRIDGVNGTNNFQISLIDGNLKWDIDIVTDNGTTTINGSLI